MIRVTAGVALLLAWPACAQPSAPKPSDPALTLPAPGATSIQLATVLGLPPLLPNLSLDTIRPYAEQEKEALRRLDQTMLAWKGRPCDQANAKCLAVARDVAKRMIADRQASRAKLNIRAYASVLQSRMTEAEMKDALRYLRTPSGTKLASAIAGAAAGWWATFQKDMLQPQLNTETPLFEEYFNRTKGLPRSTRNLPPPPPIGFRKNQ